MTETGVVVVLVDVDVVGGVTAAALLTTVPSQHAGGCLLLVLG